MDKDKKIIIVSLVLLALVAAAVYFFKFNGKIPFAPASQLDALKAKTEKFINEQMVSPGTQVQIKSIVEENGLYKITVSLQGQDVTAYVSKDGKNFFPQAFNMEAQASPSATPTPQAISKQDTPSVELFVMSYCPYGVQIEKGILPVLDLLGSKIKFSLKFLDYALHGDKEIQENLRQYCVQQQGFDKLTQYLKCFSEQGIADTCLSQAKINTSALTSCISATDNQFKITQNAKDQTLWKSGQYPTFDINKFDVAKYNVTGSPSLVINGTVVSAARDPQSLLKLICSSFSTEPSACQQQLSGDSPSPGFGTGTTASTNSTSGCASQ
jgi:hypothetical protein